MWKIVEGLIPNLSDLITSYLSDRGGRACIACHAGAGHKINYKHKPFILFNKKNVILCRNKMVESYST